MGRGVGVGGRVRVSLRVAKRKRRAREMTGTNPPTSVGGPPSAAAIARAGQGSQALKQTAQAAFEGTFFFFFNFF